MTWKSESQNLLEPSGPQPGLLQDSFTFTLKTSWYYITKCSTASSFHFSGRSTYLFLPLCISFLMYCKSFSIHLYIELEHWTFILLGWSLVLCHILTNITFLALKSNLIKICICLYFSQCMFILHLCQSCISFLLFCLRGIILFAMNSEILTQYRFLVTKRHVIR